MLACREIEPELGLLVDGLLAPDAEARVREHVAQCAACRGLLSDLQRIRASARSLGPLAPPPHVWLEVAGQVHLNGPAPVQPAASVHGSWRQWLALAAALVLITGVLYFVRGLTSESAPPAASDTAPASIETVTETLDMATALYEKAISDLELLTKGEGAPLDPSVSTVVEHSLGAIDEAITDSRAALARNPESESARDSLFEALRRKIAVLQATVALINDMRVGDQEGAAEAAQQLGKTS